MHLKGLFIAPDIHCFVLPVLGIGFNAVVLRTKLGSALAV